MLISKKKILLTTLVFIIVGTLFLISCYPDPNREVNISDNETMDESSAKVTEEKS